MEIHRGSHAMNKLTTQECAETPSSEDNALMTRLGLLLGEHRVSTVKTQAHVHPVLSHHNHNNNAAYASNERRKKSHLTTSPASTLSDKGIGSSVGSFDSEFRSNLSALAESSAFPSRTGSLDSRTTDIVSHSRSDSGIPAHSRSSSDIICTENISEVSQPRLAQQCGEKLWNADPRRRTGNTNSLPGPEAKPRKLSIGRARPIEDKSRESSRERLDSSSDVMKLPQLCLDSPTQSTAPSSHSSLASSRSVTPAVSVCDVNSYKLMKRSLSSHSNGNTVFDSEPLPPPPPPPPRERYGDQYDDLPPPPSPPPGGQDEYESNHSRASSSDRTISTEDLKPSTKSHRQIMEQNNNFLHPNHVVGKPPIHRHLSDANGNGNRVIPPVPLPRSNSHQQSKMPEGSMPTMIQRLRSSSDVGKMMKNLAIAHEEDTLRGRPQQREWPHAQKRDITQLEPDVLESQIAAAISGMKNRVGTPQSFVHSRQSSASSHASSAPPMWDESRPHSLSAPPSNPLVQNLLHRPSASFDNSYFSRTSSNRSSTRSNDKKRSLRNAASASDMRSVRFAPCRLPDVNLHAIQFELPSSVTSETKFVGREWLFAEIMAALSSTNSKTNKGVVITGSEGRGKTAIIHQLEAYSYQGNRKLGQAGSNSTLYKPEHESMSRIGSVNYPSRTGTPNGRPQYHASNHSNNSSRTASPAFGLSGSKPGSRSSSQNSLSGEEAQKRLASQVVAYHYCQADNNVTCYVPEFLHSVAAQLTQAPQLTAYRELLLAEPHLQTLLSLRSCIQNPAQALQKAILEPLSTLRQLHKLPRFNLVILLDGLGDAEQYRPDHGHSILSFLQRHLPEFPDFLKVVATCRTGEKDLLQTLPMCTVSLDIEDNKAHVTRDAQAYISHRIATSTTLVNLTLTGKPDAASTHKLLANHLLGKCQGNMLYLRLTLDLLDTGKLMPKSSGFKVIPVNLKEVFMLMCNMRFNSASSFSRVRDILAIALASLYPLRDEQLYQALCSGFISNEMNGEEFQRLMSMVSEFLVVRAGDTRRSFFHPCFREWLAQGSSDENQTSTFSSAKKFSVDPKRGHALLATVISRQPATRLDEHAALELAHHLLKARMFRGQSKTTGMNSSDLHAVWMAQCSRHLSESLATVRNLFYPNIKVSKLLLRSGANPNIRSQVLCEAPAICVAAHIGCAEFVELLLNFGADINFPATNGMTSLAYAAAAGHYQVVDTLIKHKPRLDLVDHNGHSPLLHAISRDNGKIAILLLTCDLYVSPEQRKFSALQALIAAATTGNKQLLQYLLDHPDPALHCDVGEVDPVRHESALTAAASRGKSQICEFLIRERRASVEQRNKGGMTPLLCAVKQDEWDTADLILNMGAAIEGADYAGRTPLIMAASCGRLGVVELLLSRGANMQAVDKEGLTALGWAALKGHFHCVRSLIERGSDIRHPDRHGRTPLDLAAFFGDEQIVDLLLDAGADFAQLDGNNMCALDRAIGSQNVDVISLLLKRGAEPTPMSWKLANDKPEVVTILLGKYVEEANCLYKDERYVEARDVYSRTLHHVNEPGVGTPMVAAHGHLRDLTAVLLLGLARCSRKLNDLETAEVAASRALELKSSWYEALYVRARVRRETSRLSAALRDVEEAESYAPANNKKEITRLIERIREEMKRSGRRNSISESPDHALKVPGQRHNSASGPLRRPRVNSTSSFKGNGSSRSSSPSPSVASEFPTAHSYQPQSNLRAYTPQHPPKYHEQLPHLYPRGNGMGPMFKSHSQDSLTDSRMSLPYQEPQYVPYQHRARPNHDVNYDRRMVPPPYQEQMPAPHGHPTPHAGMYRAYGSPSPVGNESFNGNHSWVPGGQYMNHPVPHGHPYSYNPSATNMPSQSRRTVATEL